MIEVAIIGGLAYLLGKSNGKGAPLADKENTSYAKNNWTWFNKNVKKPFPYKDFNGVQWWWGHFIAKDKNDEGDEIEVDQVAGITNGYDQDPWGFMLSDAFWEKCETEDGPLDPCEGLKAQIDAWAKAWNVDGEEKTKAKMASKVFIP